MRTTLTLDPDVAAALERVRDARGLGLKEAVNEAMRRGLAQLDERPSPMPPFRTRAVNLGPCLLGNVDDVSEALALAEGEDHR
jgi:hypothetical protein